MEKAHHDKRPSDWEIVVSIGIKSLVIRFDIKEIPEEEGDGFECWEVVYSFKDELSERDYGHIVSTIIRGKYSEDNVEAILNNYLSDPTNTRYEAEFNMLQSWRAEAKERARSILGLLEE